MRSVIAKDILWWKGENEDEQAKSTATEASPGGGGNGSSKQGPADDGPGKDGKPDGKPSAIGKLFAKLDVPGHKNTQNEGQAEGRPAHPAEKKLGSLPVAVLRQIKKVDELPPANKSKIAERCVRTTLRMFRKAELEKVLKGNTTLLEAMKKKVADVIMSKMLLQAQIEVETVRGMLASRRPAFPT